MDPHSVLGVSPAADLDEVGRAYREQAKRFHPDRHPGDTGAAERMATINAAYSMLKDGLTADAARQRRDAPGPVRETVPARPGRPAPAVTDERVRAALGREVLQYLRADEVVRFVTDAATHESPRVRLVVTDQRLVWLMRDAAIERVRSVDWRRVEALEGRVRGRLRKTGVLDVTPKHGRRVSFGELDPRALEQLVERVPR